MREYTHALVLSKSGKKATFQTVVNDRFGTQTINISTVTGWRCALASKHLSFKTDDWNEDITRKFVGIQALKCSRNETEGILFLDIVRSLGEMEVHFWAYKFLSNKRTFRSWRAFYSEGRH